MKKNFKYICSAGAVALLLGAAISCTEEEPINLPPSLKLNEVIDIMRIQARFSGTISGDMSQIKEYGFQYSLSEEFSGNLTKEQKVGDSIASSSCSTIIKGLEANERYYYRMYASTGASKVFSESEYFQTAASSAPILNQLVVDSIGENVVRFRCTVEDIGDEYLIEYGIGYKTSADKTYIPIPSDSIIVVSTSPFTYAVEITGLEPATTYSFRPYAKNSADAAGETGAREGYGHIESYATENQLSAVVETVEPVEGKIGMNSVEMSGRVTSAIGSDGVVDEVGFCYSQTNITPDITDTHVTATFTKLNEYFTVSVPDLQTATTYYVRAYAKNTVNGQERIGYGAVYEVTTTDIAIPQVEWVERITEDGRTTYDDVITATTYSRKAKITNYDKGALVEKGFVWSENNAEITVEEAREAKTILSVDLNVGENVIDGTITGLQMDKSYYVRAYAIYQAAGLEEIGYTWTTSFRTQAFERPRLDQVTIDDKTVTHNSAELQGRISRKGNGEYLEKGFVISLNDNDQGTYEPTLNTEGIKVVKADDNFKGPVTGLRANTAYAVRSYIISTLGGEVDTTYAWYSHLRTMNVVFPKVEIDCVNSTLSSLSFSMSITESGAGEVVEKGLLWQLRQEDNPWADFKLGDSTVSSKAFADLTHETDTMTFDGLEMDAVYKVQGYIKTKVDGEEYIAYYGTWHHRTASLSFGLYQDTETMTEISLSGFINDLVEGITEYGFCWTEDETVSPKEMTNTIKASELDAEKRFKATITGLTPNTKYYLGVYVKVGDKTYYTGTWQRTTKRIPTIDENSSPSKKD